jgi:hypothetical protein
MEFRKIDDRERVWVVTRGPEGGLLDELDPRLVALLAAADSPETLTDALVISAGELEIAATRDW